MSTFYKRIIAKKIISGIGNSQRTQDTRQLEKQLRRIIRVSPVRKDHHESSPQLMIELSVLNEYLHGKSFDISQLQNEVVVDVQVKQDSVHIKTDPGHFAKKVLEDVWLKKSSYGHRELEEEEKEEVKKVCVEYSSPNIAKPFHVGHMRSTIIGNIVANIYEAAGHHVERINFLGDWGTQFGLLSLGLMKYSDTDQLNLDPLHEFFRVYVKINQDVKSECGKQPEASSQTYRDGLALFARLEQGDESMLQLWRMVKNQSAVHLERMYERLGVHFTHVMSESEYKDQTTAVLQRLSEAGLLQYTSEGVGYVPLEGFGNIGQAAVVKSDGSSLYLTRDIASALERQEKFAFDRVHYVVEQGQRSHFIKLVSILNKLGVPWAMRPIDDIHIRFGRVQGMSTRQGKIVFLRDVLDEAKSRVIQSIISRSTSRVSQDSLEDVADILGVTAIILQDVKANRIGDYTFSWDQMLSFKSDSGVFVQYCHARLCSMLRGCGVEVTGDIDASCLANDAAIYGVILHLARYPDVFQDALSSLEPHLIVQYLFKLCHLVNVAYAFCPVKGEPTDIAQARLMVFVCARQVLANCLGVLGQKAVERM